MRVNDKLRLVMKEEKFRSVDFGTIFNCAPNVAASRFYNGIATIYDLVRLMDFMGGEVIIRSHNGTEIPITVEDVLADKIERKDRYTRYTHKNSVDNTEKNLTQTETQNEQQITKNTEQNIVESFVKRSEEEKNQNIKSTLELSSQEL